MQNILDLSAIREVIELGLKHHKEITAPVSSLFGKATDGWESSVAFVADAKLLRSDQQAVVVDCGRYPFCLNDGSGSPLMV